jgi:hypothetical protein
MGFAQDLVNAGYTGYAGWGDKEAEADYNATKGAGKFPGGDGGGNATSSSGQSIPTFNFDYAKEAEKAYGELGVYYDRLLKDSEGDINLAFSRLVEDYDRGLRTKKDTATTQEEAIAASQTEADRRQVLTADAAKANVLKRGLGQVSNFDPSAGIGVGQQTIDNRIAPFTYATGLRSKQKQAVAKDLSQYDELYGTQGIYRKRAQTDTTTKIDRNRFKLEQDRRKESADIANSRGARAYQDYLANPDLV